MNEATTAVVHATDDDALHALLQSAAQTLDPQLRDFGRWLAQQKRPPIPVQLAKLKDCTGYDWSDAERKDLLHTGVFRTYVLTLREKSVRSLHLRVAEVAVKGIDALDWALDKAMAEGDHRAIPSLVSPALERAMPRRQDLAATAPTIIIQISGAQRAILDSEAPIIDAEILAVEPPDAD